MTDREQVIEMAIACGDDTDHTLPSDIDFLCVFYRAARNEAFEQAAAVCDEHADDPVYCGEAIRALKEK